MIEHRQCLGNWIPDKNSNGGATGKLTPLQHPSETSGWPKLPINLKVSLDQGEKEENVIKPQVTCSLLISALFSETGSDHNLLQAWVRQLSCGKVLTYLWQVCFIFFQGKAFHGDFSFECALVAVKTPSLLTCLHISMNWVCKKIKLKAIPFNISDKTRTMLKTA